MILSLITKRVHPSLRHLVSEDATLSELGWGRDDTWSLLDEVEHEQGRELDWTAGERASTVAAIMAVIAQNHPGEPVS